MELHKRLHELINNKGVTPYRICADSGVSESFMSRLLTGKTKKPQPALVKTLADYFQVSFEWLMTGEGDMLKSSINEANNNADMLEDNLQRSILGAITAVKEIAESNRILAESNHDLTITNKILAISNSELVQKLTELMWKMGDARPAAKYPPLEPQNQTASDVEGPCGKGIR